MFLSKAGAGSRTDARKWIGEGRVQVNGKTIQTPDHWVDLERDRVTLDGRPLKATSKLYILLYKPKGYITTYKDPEGRPTVYDLLTGVDSFVGTVGRLRSGYERSAAAEQRHRFRRASDEPGPQGGEDVSRESFEPAQ